MKSVPSEDELHEDEGNKEIDDALHSVSENLTLMINRHGSPSEIRRKLESLPTQQMCERAQFFKDEFGKIEAELLNVKAMFRPRTPQNVFTYRPQNEINLVVVFTPYQHALLNDLSYRIGNFIELINSILSINRLCPPESSMTDDSLRPQVGNVQTTEETESRIINVCANALGIYDTLKKRTFTTYVNALLHPGDSDNPQRLIILNDSLCFYSDGITKEIELRRFLIAFADILKDEGIVDKPPQGEDRKGSPAIPYKKYAEAFSFSLDGKTKKSFKPKNIKNSATSIDESIKQQLKKALLFQV
ncbi:MAG TPA: hypothetical protein P5522_10175 [Spirochaetia bacterium]|nr:hypothetical protein [Spirochaetota bacterium]HRV29139.1 hypothetical protein [Spirochaetia bacterium]